ncbi:hypothetical protein SEA_TENNO_71 [Arthrobacter phage Tenno]|uniref:Uncharacterized protein n=1 Tax=Arthrobacter phage Tenno TaxID=2315702 RepID=A0A386KRV6_9CAUD|nr:hypothetical protein SEA_TENNO_71 [Arthrobacter phage Tenno]
MAETDQLHRFYKIRCCGQKVPHKPHVFYKDPGVYMGSTVYKCTGWQCVPTHIHEEVNEHGGSGAMGAPTKSIGEDEEWVHP